jgi:hypothetical protein
MNEILDLASVMLAAYIITLGFGLVVAKQKGASAVHKYWMKTIGGLCSFILRTIGDLFYWIAKSIRR